MRLFYSSETSIIIIGCQSFIIRETIGLPSLATKDELQMDQRTRSSKVPICFMDTLYLILIHDITRLLRQLKNRRETFIESIKLVRNSADGGLPANCEDRAISHSEISKIFLESP